MAVFMAAYFSLEKGEGLKKVKGLVWAAALRTDQKGKDVFLSFRTCRFGTKWTDNHGLYG